MIAQSVIWLFVLAQPAPMGLEACIKDALAHHPDLAVTAVGLDAARVEGKAARSSFLPNLSVQSTESYNFQGARETIYVNQGASEVPLSQPFQHDDYHSFSINLRQNVFDGGRYWLRPRRADFSLARAKIELEATRQGVTLQVIEAYLNLGGLQRAMAVLTEAAQLSRAQLELAQERYQLGAASRVDVSMAQLAVGEDAIAIERQAVLRDQGQVALNQAMGRPADRPVAVADLPAADAGEAAALPAGIREDHVELQRNRIAQRIAEVDVELSAASLYPSISTGFFYSRGDREFYKVYSRFDTLFDMGLFLSISYPIFEGFATQAAIESAEVQAERVRREQEQVRLQLDAAEANALRKLERLRTIQEIELRNVAAAEDSLTLARERYRVGDGTALEIRDAQLAVTRAKLAQVQTRYDLEIARAQYHYARGDLMEVYLPEERP